MAVQIADGFIPPLRKVMARFFALLGSIKEILLGVFWATFFLTEDKSAGGPWALVLNMSSNMSMFNS